LAGRSVVRVTYLPIHRVVPRDKNRVAQHIRLTSQQSYIYPSYAVEDDWPFDLAHVPGADDRFDYGFVPLRLFEVVARDFGNYLAAHPDILRGG
jgi:hypothetical protein